jgi:hypothetical protein
MSIRHGTEPGACIAADCTAGHAAQNGTYGRTQRGAGRTGPSTRNGA